MSNVRQVPGSGPPLTGPPAPAESGALAGLPELPDELDALREIAAAFAVLAQPAQERIAQYVASRWGGTP